MVLRFASSATKHRIAHDQTRHVVEHCGLPFVEAPPPGASGGDRLLFVGDDARGVALEVVALEIGDEELLVIHAMRLRPKYRRRYEEALEWRVTP
jgi:hypothetical protein